MDDPSRHSFPHATHRIECPRRRVNSGADDNQHLCNVEAQPRGTAAYAGAAQLVLEEPGRIDHVLAQVGSYGPSAAPTVLQCSIVHDEAIVGETFLGRVTYVRIVRLSTGRVSRAPWAPSGATSYVDAISGSGRYAAEDRVVSGSVVAAIVDTTTNKVVAELDGEPFGISWGGHVVAQRVNAGAGIEVVDWATRRVLWRSGDLTPGSTAATTAVVHARPHSDDLALDVDPSPARSDAECAIWLVGPTQAPRRVAFPVVAGFV